MKSPTSVKLKNFAEVELAYRRLRDDIAAVESTAPISQNTSALLVSMRRVLVQAVLADRYVGVWVDGSLEEAETVSYTPISSAAELHTIVRNNLKGKFQLTANIDMTAACSAGGAYYNGGEGWEPIGTKAGGEHGNPDSGFQGIFDGGGYKITGVKVTRTDELYCGLFGFVGTGGVVKNLEVENTEISGQACCGGICGGSYGLIYNCHVTGASSEIIGAYTDLLFTGNVGSVIGDNDGVVRLCSGTGTIRGLRDIGGICGDNDGLLQYCWFIGDVYCSVISDAGLISGDNKGFIEYIPMADMPVNKGTIYGCYGVGTVQSFDIAEIGSPAPTGNLGLGVGDNRGGKISSSWASGTVNGKQPDLAGFVGNNDLGDNSMGETKDSIVSNCYALATVTPVGSMTTDGAVGGFVGKNKGGQIYNCFCSSTVNGTDGVDREHIDGFCGNNSNVDYLGIIDGCYFDKSLWLAEYGDEDNLSIGKTPNQLSQQSTFDGWDFNTIWSIDDGLSFPTLPDMPEASDTDTGFVDVFPIQRIGVRSLTGDVRPKVVPGNTIFAEECEDGVVRTPIIVEDRNFPVGRDDITGGAVGKDELGDKDGDSILGFGLDFNDTTEKIDVDPGEFNGSGLDYDPDTKLLSVDVGELVLSEARIFELTYNKASDGDLNGEFAGDAFGILDGVDVGIGAVTSASGQAENGIFGQKMGTVSKQVIVWSGFVPKDYKTGTDIVIKARWCLAQDGDAGETIWRCIPITNKVERGDGSVLGGLDVGDAQDLVVPAGEAQRTMHTVTLGTMTSLESRDLLMVALMRGATHANDTCTKDILVLDKIYCEYTADKV